MAGLAGGARDRAVNSLWTAKEAVAKVRREGLRLDVRHAVVDAQPPGPGWRALRVDLDGDSTAGWWREEPGWVMSWPAIPPRRNRARWTGRRDARRTDGSVRRRDHAPEP